MSSILSLNGSLLQASSISDSASVSLPLNSSLPELKKVSTHLFCFLNLLKILNISFWLKGGGVGRVLNKNGAHDPKMKMIKIEISPTEKYPLKAEYL